MVQAPGGQVMVDDQAVFMMCMSKKSGVGPYAPSNEHPCVSCKTVVWVSKVTEQAFSERFPGKVLKPLCETCCLASLERDREEGLASSMTAMPETLKEVNSIGHDTWRPG